MRSSRTLVILAVLLVALAVPLSSVFAKPKPRAVVDAGVIWTADAVFPGTIYDNAVTQAAAAGGATGSFTVNQSAAEQFVVIMFSVAGLQPNTTYTVYLDTDGIVAGDVASVGPNWEVTGETFMTDADGAAEWYFNTENLAAGTYEFSLFINKITYSTRNPNRIVSNYTVLVSDNLNFTMN
ncbi:MAG: hypothetical protein A2Y76_06720 [Planctomycetes bacterium RBG_13_60_9]|nr:MAG: hypothetical protein A2Y76_06720 [Planctomycetes bacterium RBG_13_60_9]